MEYLRGRLSGLGIPTFVVDAPGGGGKIPVLPNYVVSMSPTHTVFRNFKGTLVSYAEPLAPGACDLAPVKEMESPTIYDLTAGWDGTINQAEDVRRQASAHRGLRMEGPGKRL